jgi:tol-pal system protein YbgF
MKTLALCIALVGFATPALADKKIEAEVAELRRILDAQSTNLATAVAQVQEIVSEFQRFTGTVDQAAYGTQQQSKVIEDSQRRLDTLEDRIHKLTIQLDEIKSAGLMNPSQVKNLAEFKSYQTGVIKVNGADYKGAIATLEGFIKANPKSAFIDSAQYWIAESHFAMRDFAKSISEFQKVVGGNAKSEKIAPAMLKQGLAFFEMQSLEDAKTFLDKVVVRFPASGEAARAREKMAEIDRILQAKAVQAVERKSTM